LRSLAEFLMSPHHPADIDPGPNAAEYVWINTIINLSAVVILYYDYFLTLPQEISFLWPPHNKLGWFTFGSLLNRYIPVLGTIPVVVSYIFPVDLELCDALHIYHEWFVLVVQSHAAALCLVRVYALYGRSRRVLGLLFVVGLAALVNTCSTMIIARRDGGETIPVISDFPGCPLFTPFMGGQFAAIAWTGLLLFDIVIFSLTLYKALTVGRDVLLLNLIARDAAMYFSALFIINLANILTLRYSPPLLRTTTATYTNVLSTTLVSRLVLNLRERSAALAGLPTTVESLSTCRFQTPSVAQRTTTSGNFSAVRQNKSTSEMATIGAVGASH